MSGAHTPQRISFTVRLSCQAYNTQRVHGHTASSTSGPEQAAQRLAQKVFGQAPAALRQVEGAYPGDHTRSQWVAVKETTSAEAALAELLRVCKGMDLEVTADRPGEDEYQLAVMDAELALGGGRPNERVAAAPAARKE